MVDAEEQRQFEAMAELASRDADADLDARIQKHVKADRRDRIIRGTSRWTMSAAAASIFGILYSDSELGGHAGTVIYISSFVILIAGAVLFFKGGMAPGGLRLLLTAKQRERLDD